ncbi:hypothetical protein EC957_011950 [Mortierella hygrophila]|uniref:Uncharacterized protein n=1 Tax=Mortierella hygrophila TaxID=979708 RepID=A0A9P6FGC4_9FUNG|nr:hypothetical protein EC957_011950 [Mortierella hygrophila]
MSQPSKPATAYFNVAVKVLRLQRALSRSKSASKPKDSSSASSPANSTPCTPTTPSFQHTNGRKVSYLQCHNNRNQNDKHRHNHNHHQYHHYRSESFDTPLYTLQRKRHTVSSSPSSSSSYSTGHHSPSSSASLSHKHGVCKEVMLLPSAPNMHSRRSASPATFPVFSIQQQQQQKASVSSLSRSKSMPNRRWKRASHQVVVVPQHLDAWVAGHAPPAAYETNNVYLPRRSLSTKSRASSTINMTSPLPSPTSSPQHQDLEEKETALSDTCEGGVQEEVLDRAFARIPNPTVSDSGPTSIDATTTAVTTLQRSNAIKATSPSQQNGDEQATGESLRNTTDTTPGSRPSRSFTSSSLSSSASSVFSTAMPLADSRMSIESQRSESSLLSAVISAGGLPSMDVMMDQVDRSIAADSQAQLVENAHVGLVGYVSVVDRNLLPEPCSAEIETWVS